MTTSDLIALSSCLLPILGVAIMILIIVAYIKTYYHIKNTSESLKRLNVQIAELNDDLNKNAFTQYNQYYYDHCFVNNLRAHEWYATGNQTDTHFEFICGKCHQIIHVPKTLILQYPIMNKTNNQIKKDEDNVKA